MSASPPPAAPSPAACGCSLLGAGTVPSAPTHHETFSEEQWLLEPQGQPRCHHLGSKISTDRISSKPLTVPSEPVTDLGPD